MPIWRCCRKSRVGSAAGEAARLTSSHFRNEEEFALLPLGARAARAVESRSVNPDEIIVEETFYPAAILVGPCLDASHCIAEPLLSG